MPRLTRKRCMLWAVLGLACLCALTVGIINATVLAAGEGRILSLEEAAVMEDVDAILVLGAGVKADGTPSDMLHDRVLTGAELVRAGSDAPLLMSGDNHHPDYDEVSAMVTLAVELGVAEDAIVTDRLGLSTYDSIKRTAELHGARRIVIVTQEYHLYRALYIAERMGIEAYGVSADVRTYRGQLMRDAREIAARCKDAILVLFD